MTAQSAGRRSPRTEEFPIAFRVGEWVFGALLAYAVALILLSFVLIAAEVVGSGPGWVTGQGSLLTMWAAYVVSMWWAPLPSLGLGALFGLALAYALRGTRPRLPTWVRSLGSARSAASSTWRSVARGRP